MNRARLRALVFALIAALGAAGLAYALAQRQPTPLPSRAPA